MAEPEEMVDEDKDFLFCQFETNGRGARSRAACGMKV